MAGKETPREKAFSLIFHKSLNNRSIKDKVDSALLVAQKVIETLTYINGIPDGFLHQMLQYWRQIYTEILEFEPGDYIEPVAKQESKEELAERALKSSRKLYEMHNGMRYDPNHADGFPHLKNIYTAGVDPVSDVRDPSSIAIKSPEGSVERLFLQSKENKDIEDYLKSGALDIQYENTWTPVAELIGESIYSLRKAHLAKKNIIQDRKKAPIIKDIEDQERLHKIRNKSKLNVIKYRRK